jgi:hypothetical protein
MLGKTCWTIGKRRLKHEKAILAWFSSFSTGFSLSRVSRGSQSGFVRILKKAALMMETPKGWEGKDIRERYHKAGIAVPDDKFAWSLDDLYLIKEA